MSNSNDQTNKPCVLISESSGFSSFVLSFFPLDVLDGIWDLIESVSEGFLTYSCILCLLYKNEKEILLAIVRFDTS